VAACEPDHNHDQPKQTANDLSLIQLSRTRDDPGCVLEPCVLATAQVQRDTPLSGSVGFHVYGAVRD